MKQFDIFKWKLKLGLDSELALLGVGRWSPEVPRYLNFSEPNKIGAWLALHF